MKYIVLVELIYWCHIHYWWDVYFYLSVRYQSLSPHGHLNPTHTKQHMLRAQSNTHLLPNCKSLPQVPPLGDVIASVSHSKFLYLCRPSVYQVTPVWYLQHFSDFHLLFVMYITLTYMQVCNLIAYLNTILHSWYHCWHICL